MMALGNMEAARFLLVRSNLLNFEAHQPWLNLATVCAGWRPDGSGTIRAERGREGGTLLTFGEMDRESADFHDAQICLRCVLYLKPNHSVARSMMATIRPITADNKGPSINNIYICQA
jgi:hypothetical protein